MYDICCVGHITLDKVVTPQAVKHMAGGTSFYFSNAIRNMDVSYTLVTSLALSEMPVVEKLRGKGIEVHATTGGETVYFENIYSVNQDHRTQRVLQKADPFTIEQLDEIRSRVYHLGPLLADDISVEFIKDLAQRGKLSLDAQGYLRKVEDKNVVAVDWPEKREALQHIHILKVNEHEMEVLTGITDIHEGAKVLNEWGVNEVVVTLGSMGSVIYTDGVYYQIPAYKPVEVVDATGCGDTYMAGYLYQRAKGKGFQEAGEFAAAMASFKIESSGPFTGTEDDVLELLAKHSLKPKA
ncbi:Sugar or nucleoside kinase, ribokinase family [Mucilaginibacter gossypiicola]|uniref:Sugar or nucleoside kinase, ribokinase family n=1 Tax=Mucilaginibacter gossypiicola TaxID=551995 RepID=A0A1H8QRS6_9SPHI|nr:PfkB family carbohydrate kinase [Mucilaginibacter gossypiicola]SEO56553.1 Sugar or nucleoside kinase, ribokinase family [Mucilaginibacter gossypiicola]